MIIDKLLYYVVPKEPLELIRRRRLGWKKLRSNTSNTNRNTGTYLIYLEDTLKYIQQTHMCWRCDGRTKLISSRMSKMKKVGRIGWVFCMLMMMMIVLLLLLLKYPSCGCSIEKSHIIFKSIVYQPKHFFCFCLESTFLLAPSLELWQ